MACPRSPLERIVRQRLEDCLGNLCDALYKVTYLLRGRLHLLVVITQVAYITKVLMKAPLWCLNYCRVFQSVIEVGDRWILLRELDIVSDTNLVQVLFKHYARYGAGGTHELVFQELPRGIELRVQEVGLHQLTDVEKRTLEPAFDRFKNGHLLIQMGHCGTPICNNLASIPSDSEALKRILDPVVLKTDFLTPFWLLVKADEVAQAVREKLIDQNQGFGIPGLIRTLEVRECIHMLLSSFLVVLARL